MCKLLQLWLATAIITVIAWGEARSQITELPSAYGSALVSEGVDLFNHSLLRKAEKDFSIALKKFSESPSDGRLAVQQALFDFYTGNYKIADGKLVEYMVTNRTSPYYTYAAMLRAYIAFEQKDYARSEVNFAEAYKSATEEYEMRKDTVYRDYAHQALYWRGIALYLNGKEQDAVSVFEDCYTKYPNEDYSDDAIYALGLIAEKQHKFDAAVSYYATIPKKYPYSNTVLSAGVREVNNRLLLRDATGAIATIKVTEGIIEHINKGDSIGTDYPPQSYAGNVSEDLQYLKGEAYNIAANYSMAILSFSRFLETYNQSHLVNYARLGAGWALLNTNENDSAVSYFDKIIETEKNDESPTKAIAQLYRSVAIKRSGKKEIAQKELIALASKANYPYPGQVLLELGQLYYEAGKFEEARRTLERADRESGEAIVSVRIHLLLGATYLEMKNWQKSVTEYNSAEQLVIRASAGIMPNKDFYLAEIRLKRGIALVMTHRYNEAIPSLLAFIGDNKHSPRLDEGMFWLAEAYYRSDLLKNAAETFKNIIVLFPQSGRREEAFYGQGWSYFRLKEFDKSSDIFDKMLKEYPDSKFGLEVLARQADGYYHIKNYKNAAESYKKASNFAPRSEEGQYCAYQLCHALYRQGTLDQASSAALNFVRLYQSSPYAPYALYLIGWIKFQQKSYDEAIEHFKYLIKAYPQSDLLVRANYAIGDANYNRGSYEAAIEAYKIVIDSYPSDPLAPEAMRGVQYCLVALGKEDEAMKIAESYIEANPKSPFAQDFRFKRAEMFYTGKKFSDAVAEYDNFIKKNPGNQKNDEAMYWMAKSYSSMNDFGNAEKTYRELKSKYPNSDFAPISMLELALLKKQTNQIDKAEIILRDLQKEYPTNQTAAQAGFELAEIKMSMADTAKALLIYKEVAATFAGQEYSDQSYWKLGMYYRSVSNDDSAIAYFRKLTGRLENPNLAAEAYFRIGEIQMQEGRTADAILSFTAVRERFAGMEDWYSLSLLNLGECYEKTEKINEAIEVYTILQALRGEDDYGKTVQNRLKRLKKE